MKIETKETENNTIRTHIEFEECQTMEKIVQHLVVITKTVINETCKEVADEEITKETMERMTYQWLAEIFNAFAKGEIDG